MTPTPAIAAVYCDGGVILKNPSPHGGAWCYVRLDAAGRLVDQADGLILPAEAGLPAVSNNLTELAAAVFAMETLPDGWAGTIYTDSLITKKRITAGRGFAGIPDGLRFQCLAERARLGEYRVVLLAGHPSKDDLFRGFKRKKAGRAGLPVSKWNQHCDRRCQALQRQFVARLGVAFGVAPGLVEAGPAGRQDAVRGPPEPAGQGAHARPRP